MENGKSKKEDEKVGITIAVVLAIAGLVGVFNWQGAQQMGAAMADHTRVLDAPNAGASATGAIAGLAAASTAAQPDNGFVFTRKDGQVFLLGKVADEGAKKNILEAAVAIFGASAVVDQLSVEAGAPTATWKIAPHDLFGKLKSLDTFDLQIHADQSKLTGTTTIEAAKKGIDAEVGNWFVGASSNIALMQAPVAVVPAMPSTPATPNFDAEVVNLNIVFASNSAVLSDEAKTSLKPVVDALKGSAHALHITGHTSCIVKRTCGKAASDAENNKLSMNRALAVQKYLQAQGVDTSKFTLEGKGSTSPVADNATEEGRAKNRRIEFKPAQ